MKRKLAAVASVVCLFWVLAASEAIAQATRTWVSGVGDDANPCSRTAPCKTFAGAISKTAVSGEIDALDRGGFGAVTITKSITIDGAETSGGILASLTNGVIINAAGIKVVLRNIAFQGAGNGLDAIRVLQAQDVVLEHVTISGFGGEGVDIQNTGGTARVIAKDVDIRGVTGSAFLVKPGAGQFASLMVDDSHITAVGNGIRAEDRALVTVRNTMISNAVTDAFRTLTTVGGSVSQIFMQDCVASFSATGLGANGAGASALITRSTVYRNSTGLAPTAGGVITSFGDNIVNSNSVDGAPSGAAGKI